MDLPADRSSLRVLPLIADREIDPYTMVAEAAPKVEMTKWSEETVGETEAPAILESSVETAIPSISRSVCTAADRVQAMAADSATEMIEVMV